MSASSSSPARTYIVEGMTCRHCVMSVQEEISEVPGVEGVQVDLDSGRVAVSGADFSDDGVRAAVNAAGYELAS